MAMTCSTCGGMIISEFGERRCFSCGRHPNAVSVRGTEADEPGELIDDQPAPRRTRTVEDVVDVVMQAVRARRGPQATKEDEMPKFVSEEHRQRWIEGQRNARELKKKTTAGGGAVSAAEAAPARRGRPPKALVPALSKVPDPVPFARPVRSAGVPTGVLEALGLAMEENEADRLALVRVKDILER